MPASKSAILLSFLLMSISGFAQNQNFYWGFSGGFGWTLTHLESVEETSTRLGNMAYAEFSLNYRLNDVWGLQMYVGHHDKGHQFSAVNYYRDRFYNSEGGVNFKQRRANLAMGINLSFRQPVNVQQGIYLGGILGYGRNWYGDQWSGEFLEFGSCRNEFGSIEGCRRNVFQDYVFEGKKNDYVSTGVFVDFNLPIKDLEAFNILRISAMKRTGLGSDYSLQGTMTLNEQGEKLDELVFNSKGSTIALEIALFLLM